MRGTIPSAADVPEDPIVIVSAYNEADRLPATVAALRGAVAAGLVEVADDATCQRPGAPRRPARGGGG